MSDYGMNDLASFTKVKGEIYAALTDGIKLSLYELGKDAKCIPWFSSKADHNYQAKAKTAA